MTTPKGPRKSDPNAARTARRATSPTGGKPGRPSLINKIIAYRDVDGTQVGITVAEHLTASLRTGNYFEPACLAAGISTDTGYTWLKLAALARIRGTGDIPDDATAHERDCIQFADQVSEAESLWEVSANSVLEQAQRGGRVITRTTTKYDPKTNKAVERTVVEIELPPDPRVAEWRLERRNPKRYGHRVELIDERRGLSADEHAAAILASLDEIAGVALPELVDAPSSNGHEGGSFT